MPYQEEPQPLKSVAELQEECEAERLAIVDYDLWKRACLLMAAREYENNLKNLNYARTLPSNVAATDPCCDGLCQDDCAIPTKAEEKREDPHHDRESQPPLE